MKHLAYDAAAAGGTTVLLWTHWLSPILQAAALILGVLFLALGVALRWRALRRGGRIVEDDTEC